MRLLIPFLLFFATMLMGADRDVPMNQKRADGTNQPMTVVPTVNGFVGFDASKNLVNIPTVLNAYLQDSTITINGTPISLGGSIANLQTTTGTLALAGFSGITGVLPVANYATGTFTGTEFVRGDGTLANIPGGGDALTSNPLSQFASTTSAQFKGVISDENGVGKVLFADGTLVIPTGDTLTVPAGGGTLGTAAFTSSTAYVAAAQVTGGGVLATGGFTLTVGGTSSINGTFAGTSSGTNTGDQTITLTGVVTGSGTGSFATTITAGSVTNAMLANSAVANLSGTNSGDVTIGTANGLSLVGQAISMALASTSTTGSLSSTDWNTFNNKQSALTFGTGVVSALAVNVGSSGAFVVNTTTVNGHALTANVSVTASDVGLGNVTNDTQTKASIVPNTAPSSAQILVGNAGGTAYAPVSVSGDITFTSAGVSSIGSNKVTGAMISLTSESTGNLMYFDGTDWVRLANGTSGLYLKSNGPGSPPTYDAPTGSGDVTGPGSATANAVATFSGTSGKIIADSTQLIDSAAATATTVVGRDSSGQIRGTNFISSYLTTATSNGTTTMATGGGQTNFFFTGTSNHTFKLSATSLLVVGQQFRVTNLSTGTITINDSTSTLVGTVVSNTTVLLTVVAQAGAPADWTMTFDGTQAITGTGSMVRSTSPTLVTPILGTPTSGNGSNLTNTVGYGIKTATTTVSVSGATAPTAGQQLTATSTTDAVWEDQTTIATEQATTSGTSKDFTSIPSGVKQITVMFVGVSTNGTSAVLIQIGDSGGIETTGYTSDANVLNASSGAALTSTAGFLAEAGGGTTTTRHGSVTLSLEDSSDNTWVESGVITRSVTGGVQMSGGSKATSAVLDRVRITTANGTDAFDAGVISISYTK